MKKLVTVFMIVFTVMASSFAFYFYQVLYTPNILVDGEEQYFAIPSGSSFKEVQELLVEQNVVGNLMAFSLLAKLKSYDESVKPGLYLLQPDMNNSQTINLLRSGSQTPVKLIFSVARLLQDLPGKVEDFVEFDSMRLAALMLQES
ncbi:MAG: endolytic transglycosylase MltG, partial [Bacteroidota bacterium]